MRPGLAFFAALISAAILAAGYAVVSTVGVAALLHVSQLPCTPRSLAPAEPDSALSSIDKTVVPVVSVPLPPCFCPESHAGLWDVRRVLCEVCAGVSQLVAAFG
jgi:hypothetical protein